MALFILIGSIIYAWLLYQRELITVTKVSTPIELEIRSGNQDEASMIDLGDIDVTDGTEKLYVFCVRSDKECNYGLQLAYTTNIPFTYEVYHASEVTSGGAAAGMMVAYDAEDGDTYYYKAGNLVGGSYLNLDEATGIANQDDSYMTQTYGGYTNVQENAVPVYWQSDSSAGGTEYENMHLDDDNKYLQYYILRVRWDGVENISNDGETDIIYITTKSM